MPYEIWRSLNVQQKLQILEANNPEIFKNIVQELELLAIKNENFITGEPNRFRVFYVDNLIIVYIISHRLKIIELVDIRELD